jgi:hypothetical protein
MFILRVGKLNSRVYKVFSMDSFLVTSLLNSFLGCVKVINVTSMKNMSVRCVPFLILFVCRSIEGNSGFALLGLKIE